MRDPRRLVPLLCLLLAAGSAAQVTLTQGTNFSVDAAPDGRLAIDLLGSIWLLPAAGGDAVPIASGALPAHRPRWSPDGGAIAYQARDTGGDRIWLYEFAAGAARSLSSGGYFDQQPAWHPDGSRIVFSSERRGTGFDLWETDLATGLAWRLTDLPGDETEPTWSRDGRHLVYVHHEGDRWSIVLRRFGEPDRIVETADRRLSAPRWRPDGSLVTFLRHGDNGLSIDMAILSDPALIRPLVEGEDFFLAPVAWQDRQTLLYTADGLIRRRNFDAFSSRTLPFKVTVRRPEGLQSAPTPQRKLPESGLPNERLVLRVGRLYDGLASGYRGASDILIDKGRIAAIEEPRDRPGEILVNMGDLTALPGFIDGYASLPDDPPPALGPLLLSFGVTTVVAEHARAEELSDAWSGKDLPGPRVLAAAGLADAAERTAKPWLVTTDGDLAEGLQAREAVAAQLESGVPVLATNWQAGLGTGTRFWLGADALPTSPGGSRYENGQLAGGAADVTIFSGLADIATPGVAELLASRQAALLGPFPDAPRRFAEPPLLGEPPPVIVLASRANGLPPGIAQQAELRAMQAAGLSAERALRASAVNAAAAIGASLQIGRIAPGSLADIVIVDGDPLANVADAAKVVGLVRNGRFFSAIGLIERASAAAGVE